MKNNKWKKTSEIRIKNISQLKRVEKTFAVSVIKPWGTSDLIKASVNKSLELI